MSKRKRKRKRNSGSQLEEIVGEHEQPPHPEAAIPILPGRADRLLSILESMNAWVGEFDSQARLIFSSPHVEAVLGFTAEECLTTDCIEFHPADIPQVIAISRKVRETGEIATNEARIRHKNGHWVWVANSLLGWYASDEGGFHTICVSRDLSTLKNAEAARLESETRYRIVSEMSADLILELDLSGSVTYAGPGSDSFMGYTAEEMKSLPPWSRAHPDDVERIRAQIAEEFRREVDDDFSESRSSRDLRVIECRVRHRDGRWLWFEALGLTYRRADGEIRYLAVSRDVTERKEAERSRRELEERMQQAQRLDSLGVLAGGIAHDFNNLLTPILGRAGLALRDLPPGSPIAAHLESIQQSAERAAALTSQMLAYAGQRPLRVGPLDLSKQVEEMRELIIASISGHATLDIRLARGLPAVEAEAAQIGQVIMNLVTNAAESLGEADNRIFVRTGVVDLESAPRGALFGETIARGQYVYFEVKDTGCGMDDETRDRVFDPFFTTKFAGRGLGLAAVAGIVRGHGGALQVESHPGRGTRFRVLLPAVSTPAVAHASPPAPINEWRANGTVLVIDDDEGVCELAEEVLRGAGLQVLTAGDGHEGVKLFGMHADSIRLVLLDLTMPSLGGAETFDAICSVRPDAKIVLVSGYTEERVTVELAGRGLAGFLQKPFPPDTLLWRVRDAMESD